MLQMRVGARRTGEFTAEFYVQHWVVEGDSEAMIGGGNFEEKIGRSTDLSRRGVVNVANAARSEVERTIRRLQQENPGKSVIQDPVLNWSSWI